MNRPSCRTNLNAGFGLYLAVTAGLMATAGCVPKVDIEGNQVGECSDGADNDVDGLYDCADTDCFAAPSCQNGYYPTDANQFDDMLQGQLQLDALCARLVDANIQSVVRDSFCAQPRPQISSAQDLLTALGLPFNGPLGMEAQLLWNNGNPAWSVIGHSAGLARRTVSPVNPRVIVQTPVASHSDPTPGFVIMAFTRGEGFAEIITHDPVRDDVDFFAFKFTYQCADPGNCTATERYGAQHESGWLDYTIYGAEDLENTPLDCLQCHEHGLRDSPSQRRSPLMFQLNSMWMHWLYNVNFFRGWTDNPADQGPFHAMLQDYVSAHRTEDAPLGETFGGIPGGALHASRPKSLEDLIEANGFGNGFDSTAYAADGAAIGLLENGRARGLFFEYPWEELYELSLHGLLIGPPGRGASPFDESKLAALISDYSDHQNGLVAEFPEMTDLYDDADLSAVALSVHPGLSPPEMLVHACSQCHHDGLNQDLSRAKFKIGPIARGRAGSNLGDHFAALDLSDLQMVRQRINLPSDHLAAMPPARFRSLSAQEITAITRWLDELIVGLDVPDDGSPPLPTQPEFEIPPREVVVPGPDHLSEAMISAMVRKRQTSMAVMRALPGVDPRSYIEYYFEETSGSPGGTSSGWQVSPRYLDTKLILGETYRYRFKMRDRAGNESPFSVETGFHLTQVDLECDHDEHEHPALGVDGIDTDCDSVSDSEEGYGDTDQDGIPDYLDEDDDGDAITTYAEREDGVVFGNDVDSDGTPNWLDTDSDNDGILDFIEGGMDANDNGIPGYLDPNE